MRNWFTNRLILKRGKGGYFARLLLSSLLILAVPVVLMGSIWYYTGRRAEKKQALDQEQFHMDLMSQDVANQVSNLERRIIYLEYGKIYQAYQLEKTPSATVDMISEMNNIQSMSNIVASIYFMDRERDWVYSTVGQAKSIQEFHDTKWLEMLEEKVSIQHLPVRINLDELYVSGNDVYYNDFYDSRQVLSLVSDGGMDAYFVVNLDVQSIAEELYRKYISDSRELYLTDGQGTILFGCSENTERLETGTFSGFKEPVETGFWWNQGKYLYYARQIGYENVYCVEKISYDLIYGNMKEFALVILSVIVLITVSTILLTTVNVRRLYQPIGNLYQNLEESGGYGMSSGDEIAAITRTVKELNQSQKNNTQEIMRQREQLQSEMLRLMLNQMVTQEDFLKETLLDEHDVSDYRFLVCRMSSRKLTADAEQSRQHLKEALNTYLTAKEKGIFTEYRYGVYAALYQSGEEDSTDRVLYEALSSLMEEQIYCAVSGSFHLTEPLVEIFKQTDKESRDRKFFDSEKAPESQEAVEDISITNYEACLIRDILLGDCGGIHGQMSALQKDFERIWDRERVVESAQRILITVDKECRTRQEADEVNAVSISLQECETLTELMEMLEKEFQNASAGVKKNGNNENEYYTRACAYIQENYYQNMNVSEVADHLGISYAYLSKIFKQQSEGGEKLLDYLNKIRIEKAKELLSETNLSLTEVAEKVGYNNAQSLQRFFKKYENVTPGDYRKMQGKK